MQAGKKPVVVVGSINIDLVVRAERIPVEGETVQGRDFQIHPGGKGANQAVAVGRLGYPVAMIGRIGDDAFGEQLREHLAGAGVDISAVAVSPGTSGVAVIVVSDNGENSIVITPGANAHVSTTDIDANLELIRSAGVVLAQLEIPILTVLHLARICAREKVPLILDPAPAQELPAELFEIVEWFTPNETEAAFFTGNADAESSSTMAQFLMGKGIKGVLLKLGSRGVYIATRAHVAEQLPPFAVKAVDTTAAGDAFNGAFATGLMMNLTPVESARFAAAAAAVSVTRPGAQPSMPSIAEVEQMLHSATGSSDS
ncbi:ribokinase [Paracidobacterium acidisoli]|uniref:Ribokinase n=1 Tax=Paracidobacterium acidisoli TaxID=2303751 RepID=A0A372IS30_9BACT|nr:ribokinase [Paracidobacterium acidisoli]MBT9330632.1 ribokinase [Paracidobacterium acidisoli]